MRRCENPGATRSWTVSRRAATVTTFLQEDLQCIDFKVPLGYPPLEARILLLQLSQPLGIWDGYTAKPLAPAEKAGSVMPCSRHSTPID
jgi:hypothetical protein